MTKWILPKRESAEDDNFRLHGEKMQDATGKNAIRRFDPRNPTEADITCRPYTSNSALPASDGVMRNFSNNGFYIETSDKFDAGAILIVRMLSYPPITSVMTEKERPRTICLAEVKWQREIVEQSAIRYGMGLRYLN